MKKLIFYAVATLMVNAAHAVPGSDDRDAKINGATGLRMFNSTSQCEADFGDASWVGTIAYNACDDGWSCTKDTKLGINVDYTDTCCRWMNMYCREDGSLKSDEEIIEAERIFEQQEAARQAAKELAAAMDSSTVTTYWGYYQSSNKSPNNGRTVSGEAKLDACIGHGNVDHIKTLSAFTQLNTCRGATYCGSSANQHCTSTMANGETLCQDRCDCIFGGTCNNY